MSFELFQEVALGRDLPEPNLRAGDLCTIVEFVVDPTSGENGCVLEVFSAVGKTIAVISVPLSAVEALTANEVLAVRPLAPTA
jgi:hypothetical protein